MAWIRVESSVGRNKKFVKAGPAPSWLWLCGLGYCQEGLTDGFIPREVLPYLGVKNAGQLAEHLVKAGLWDEAEDGWRVHDYLEHNRSAYEVSVLKERRADGGKLGGRPRKNLPDNHKVSGSETIRETFPVDVDASVVVDASVSDPKKKGAVVDLPPMDLWARELLALAPPGGKCGWNLVERPLFNAIQECKTQLGALDDRQAFVFIRDRLEQHGRSHQWRIKGMVKRLDRWLSEGLYLQELSEDAPVADRLSKSTNRTLAAAAEIMRGDE